MRTLAEVADHLAVLRDMVKEERDPQARAAYQSRYRTVLEELADVAIHHRESPLGFATPTAFAIAAEARP